MSEGNSTNRAERCDKCKFWELNRKDGPSDDWDGICRRYPPILNTSSITAGIQEFNSCDSVEAVSEACGSGSWQQPWTCASQWCGEFKPADTTCETVVDRLDDELPAVWLGVRARRAMNKLGIKTFRELTQKTADDFLALPDCGLSTVHRLREFLADRGLKLRGD